MILLRNTTYNSIESGASKINYIYTNFWDAVTYPCPDNNCILAKPLLKLWQVLVIVPP